MKRLLSVLVPSIAAVLAACSTPPPAAHGPGHQQAMSDACAAHRQAGTPEERRAAAEAHIVQMHGSADAQHVERHLRMMDQRCGSTGGAAKPGV